MSTTFYAIGAMPLTDEGRAELTETLAVRRRDVVVLTDALSRYLDPGQRDRCERSLADARAHVANIERALDTGFC